MALLTGKMVISEPYFPYFNGLNRDSLLEVPYFQTNPS